MNSSLNSNVGLMDKVNGKLHSKFFIKVGFRNKGDTNKSVEFAIFELLSSDLCFYILD